MKKLMFAAAIVCLAAISQAASFKWSASGINDVLGKSPYSGDVTIYAFLKSDASRTIIKTFDTTMNNGVIDYTDSSDKFSAGTVYSFYYMMTDKDGNVFTSGDASTAGHATLTRPVNFGSTGSWQTVPEPTSGLSLLVGVAGLALRRRRA